MFFVLAVFFIVHICKIITRTAFTALLLFYFCFGIYEYLQRELPSCDYLSDYHPTVLTRVYANDLKLYREFSKERRIFTPYEAVPDRVIQAFISAEDKHFFTHGGLDFWSVFRAALENTVKNAWGKKPLGASTITQQVAKNFVVGSERSMERKIKEAIVSLRLEETLSKERILELYLNEIYLGNGAYGVAAAALTYFNKNLGELSIAECAYLASLPKAPSAYDPRKDYAKVKARRDWVVGRMQDEGYITDLELKAAQDEKIVFSSYETIKVKGDYYAEQIRRELVESFGEQVVYKEGLTVYSCMDERFQKITDKTLQDGLLSLDKAMGYRGPLMRLSLSKDDLNWPHGDMFEWFQSEIQPLPIKDWTHGIVLNILKNKQGEEIAEVGLRNGEKIKLSLSSVQWAKKFLGAGKFGPTPKKVSDCLMTGDVILISHYLKNKELHYRLEQVPEITGAIVVMDPLTGDVLSLSGGFNFHLNQFNNATQAKRQPGSVFKPFVYMTALENGYDENSIIDDSPIEINLGKGQGIYAPKNFTGLSYGPSPLRVGIEQSRNQMTVRLAQELGMAKVVEMSKRFFLYDRLSKDLAMSLGAGETTLLKLVTAYAIIANGGKRVFPTLLKKVQDKAGKSLYNHPIGFVPVLKSTDTITPWDNDMNDLKNRPQFWDNRDEIISEPLSTTMLDFLRGVVLRGTAKRLAAIEQKYNLTIYAKTGTSNDCKDAWIISYLKTAQGQQYIIGVFVGYPIPQSMGTAATGGVIALPFVERFIKLTFPKSSQRG
jgi:penicillin-binding protein 1A